MGSDRIYPDIQRELAVLSPSPLFIQLFLPLLFFPSSFTLSFFSYLSFSSSGIPLQDILVPFPSQIHTVHKSAISMQPKKDKQHLIPASSVLPEIENEKINSFIHVTVTNCIGCQWQAVGIMWVLCKERSGLSETGTIKYTYLIYSSIYQNYIYGQPNLDPWEVSEVGNTENNFQVHEKDKKIIRNSQHGFTKRTSCLNNLISFYNELTTQIDEGRTVVISYLGPLILFIRRSEQTRY